jgi:hypothetical protein
VPIRPLELASFGIAWSERKRLSVGSRGFGQQLGARLPERVVKVGAAMVLEGLR